MDIPKRSIGDPRLPKALSRGFAFPFTYQDTDKPTMLSELAELRAYFDLLPEDASFSWGPHVWQLGLGHGSAVLYRYACCPEPHTSDRSHLEAWTRALASAGFEGERASCLRIAFRKQNTQKISQSSTGLSWKVLGDNGVLAWQLGYGSSAHYTFVEHAPQGEFQVVTDPDDDISGPGWATSERIDSVIAEVAERGPLPIVRAATLVAKETGLSPAQSLLWSVAELDGDVWGLVQEGRQDALDLFADNPSMQPWPTHTKNQIAIATGVWMAGPWEELWDAEVLAERISEQFFVHHAKPERAGSTATEEEFD